MTTSAMYQQCLKLTVVICLFQWGFHLHGQAREFPYDIQRYDFIRYGQNRILFPGDSSRHVSFLAAFDHMIRTGTGQHAIVHIGGSHLQADIYSDQVRKRLQTFQPGNNGGRGFVFPYAVARTNNPVNFKVRYAGRWQGCRNVQRNKTCVLGLSGISVNTQDTSAWISIRLPDRSPLNYDFNRIKVFFVDDGSSYDHEIVSNRPVSRRDTQVPGMDTWYLADHTDSLQLRIRKTSDWQQHFGLLGFSLETDDPGMVYHAIGVNGAKIPSFLRCSLLPDQLAELSPGMVILSLGTNDAYTRYFDPVSYRQQYDTLIREIRAVLPASSIVLTVPNDSYLYRRFVNRNTEKVRQVILDLAAEHGCGVWDFYTVMGGLNSIITWQRFGLAKRDRIHFTRRGYLLKGDLFFNAFLRSYDDYIDRTNGKFASPVFPPAEPVKPLTLPGLLKDSPPPEPFLRVNSPGIPETNRP